MKIYKTQQEVEKDIVNGVLAIEGDVRFECSISISASIKVTCGNITAGDITARDINAGNITAVDINAGDINAGDINAGNINAGNINAGDINAWNINAGNILYYAFCCVYNFIKCKSIKAKRKIYSEPICLEGKVEIISTQENKNPKEIIVNNAKYRLVE